ncbi:sodium-dependent transporter [Gehongia tenuis]|uniref:Transporter n=1 Tax=Gehongia tenuis TaxID=2763655 RepID=A0A926D4R9_9FIRM|nr:sodium-dependent transporter [Gehongia tenuis]MBC8531236.1 sodium-dependent transporter [Gehongia tenuis]
MENRSNFSSRIGFVLAAAGSAVGLGNIWRFPYLAAKYGGGIFLLVYILLVVSFGFAIMMAEIAIGRKTGLSAIGAYRKLNQKYAFIGIITSLVPMIILPYYSVIGGWVTKYFVTFLGGSHTAAAGDNFFTGFISSPVEPIVWFAIFLALTFVVVLLGVKRGIEKANKFLMPALVVLSVVVAVYAVTLPGAGEGVKYYLMPDFSKFSIKTVLGALGQMFYSMSLAMGIMITYGSYMKKEADIEKSVKQIEWFDTGIALLAGLMIVPAVFVFTGGNEASLKAGPGLMFQTLPKVFESMGAPTIIGSLFFLLVLFAALTSSISLMETVVSIFQDKFKWKRTKACIIVFLGAFVVGLTSSLGYGPWSEFTILGFSFLDFYDFISNSVIMPIVALMTCLFVAYVIGTKTIIEEVKLSSQFKREKIFTVMIKYIAPVCILAILITSVLGAFNIFSI